VSQVLTLYTTPVIYIFFDNLGARFSRIAESSNDASAQPETVGAHESVAHLHRAAGCDHSANQSLLRLLASSRSSVLPVSPLPQVDFPVRSRVAAQPTWREPGHHGIVGRHAA
jgi:hypothetical protein